MSNTPNARFALTDYTFTEFNFKTPNDKDNMPIIVNFMPSGKHYINDKKFDLYLFVSCKKEGSEDEFIKIFLTANFSFTDNDGLVPDFFYKNSIAIIFPYIRAFISTLTLQSNEGLVMLPTLNLSKLDITLKENTIDITE